LAGKEEDPAATILSSYPSLGCEVLKIGKSVSRVDEPSDEWQPIEGIPIGEQPIQCKRHSISVFPIFPQSAVGGLRPPLMMGQNLVDPFPVILKRGAMAWKRKLHKKPLTDAILSPTISFRGNSDLPGAGINLGFRYYVKPYKMEVQSHHHNVDEYLFFLGAQLPDLMANFDAEIEIFLGPEHERHIITRPCISISPKGLSTIPWT
jgi:hypothetical protein